MANQMIPNDLTRVFALTGKQDDPNLLLPEHKHEACAGYFGGFALDFRSQNFEVYPLFGHSCQLRIPKDSEPRTFLTSRTLTITPITYRCQHQQQNGGATEADVLRDSRHTRNKSYFLEIVAVCWCETSGKPELVKTPVLISSFGYQAGQVLEVLGSCDLVSKEINQNYVPLFTIGTAGELQTSVVGTKESRQFEITDLEMIGHWRALNYPKLALRLRELRQELAWWRSEPGYGAAVKQRNVNQPIPASQNCY